MEWTRYFAGANAFASDTEATDADAMRAQADTFLRRRSWGAEVKETYIGLLYPGLVGVFLFRLTSDGSAADEWIWVVTGSVPSACVSCQNSPNAASALDIYIGTMLRWIASVEDGSAGEELAQKGIRIEAQKTDLLKQRLRLMDHRILVNYGEDFRWSRRRERPSAEIRLAGAERPAQGRAVEVQTSEMP